jgi:hypothetical protein
VTDSHGPKVPRASAMVMRESLEDLRGHRKRRAIRRTVAGVVVLVALVWGANAVFFGRPVASAIAADSVVARVRIAAHLHYYLDPLTLVLDLRQADAAAPERAFYGLLVAAAAIHTADLGFKRVILTRGVHAAFIISGDDFDRLGAGFTGRGSPLEWAWRVPAKLRGPGGAASPGLFAGPLPPLLGLRPPDAVAAARRWMSGGQ